MSDHWKTVFEFCIRQYENGCSCTILLKHPTVSYPSTIRSKHSNCTVTLSKYLLRKIRRYTSIIITHCRKICEIQRYTALSNTVKHSCNSPYFSISGLVQTPFLKQSRYGDIRSVIRIFYRVRQCSIPLYFTYRFAVKAIYKSNHCKSLLQNTFHSRIKPFRT